MATNLKIDGARLWAYLMESAAFGRTEKGGIRRLALSDEDKRVRDWFAERCNALGLTLAVDELGNMFATRAGRQPDLPTIAFGSHLDTQPKGGKFDGILGVLAGLEALETMVEAGYETDHPLTLVNWTNEEGARFAPAMMCSGVYSGDIDKEAVRTGVDNEGAVFADELARIGYQGEEPVGAREFGAFIELHIEQGPLLEQEGKQIGVVEGGQGLLWFDGKVTGRDSHAGTTPMTMRKDAFLGLCEVALAVERIAKAHGPAGVGTMGEAHAIPGARNTIPGEATFKAEFRHPDKETLATMRAEMEAALQEIGAARGVDVTLTTIWGKDPTRFAPVVVEAIAEAAEANGLPAKRMISGAGHDAFYVANRCPTAMLFIPCKDGISHNEEESCLPQDCAAGAQVLMDAVLRLDRAGLGGA